MPDRQQVLFARFTLVIAAILWSSGSFFTRVLTAETPFALNDPKLTPVQIALWRGLFAGIALIPLLRRVDLRFHPLMPWMVGCFAVMCGLYLSALGLGNAANAILLQNTAPVWVYFIGVYLLGQQPDRGALRSTLLGLFGALLIIVGNWPHADNDEDQSTQMMILMMGAGSGLTYAGVVLFLNQLRMQSSAWLMVLNMIGSAICLGLFVAIQIGPTAFVDWLLTPTRDQLLFMSVFGVVQMAAPYWLFARGLRYVTALEAGIITLLEPVLNPIWAYLITDGREKPTIWTFLGGLVLLAALVWRYIPTRSSSGNAAKR